MARRPTNFEKDKNKKWSCALALTLAREEADGERGKTLLSSFLFLLSAPSSVCCVPARCPSDCPSSLFILTTFYPGGMINGFTEAPRYLPLHPSSDPTLRSFPKHPVSFPLARIGEFSAFLRARLSLSRSLSIAIVRHWYTSFLCSRCIALISRRSMKWSD